MTGLKGKGEVLGAASDFSSLTVNLFTENGKLSQIQKESNHWENGLWSEVTGVWDHAWPLTM